MDPPEHSRLRRLLSRSFTPRAVASARGPHRGARPGHRRPRVRRARGECDFAKDVAADLPLLALADVLGVPDAGPLAAVRLVQPGDRLPGPRLRLSAAFDPAAGTAMAREALAVRPAPGAGGRMPDPRTRAGMPDLYAYAHLLGEEKRRRPGDDVMSILLAQSDDGGGTGHGGRGVREHLLAVRRRRQRDPAQRPARRRDRAARAPASRSGELRADPDLLPGAVDEMLRWWTPVMTFRRTAAADSELGGAAGPVGRQGRRLVHLGQPGRGGLRRPGPVRRPPRRPTRTWRSATARTSAWAPTWRASRCARCSPRCWPATSWIERPAPRPTCAPTSSAASSDCRCAGPPEGACGSGRCWPSRGSAQAAIFSRACSTGVAEGALRPVTKDWGEPHQQVNATRMPGVRVGHGRDLAREDELTSVAGWAVVLEHRDLLGVRRRVDISYGRPFKLIVVAYLSLTSSRRSLCF